MEHKKVSNAVKSYFKTAIRIVVVVLSLIIIILTVIRPQENKDLVKSEKTVVKAKTQKVIVLKPGENIPLEINDKEWSSWIDASFKGMHANIRIQGDRKYQFSDGKVMLVRKGNPVKLPTDVYRIKTVKGEEVAVIKTAMHPINKELFN